MGKPSDDAVDVKGREKPEPTIWEMPPRKSSKP